MKFNKNVRLNDDDQYLMVSQRQGESVNSVIERILMTSWFGLEQRKSEQQLENMGLDAVEEGAGAVSVAAASAQAAACCLQLLLAAIQTDQERDERCCAARKKRRWSTTAIANEKPM